MGLLTELSSKKQQHTRNLTGLFTELSTQNKMGRGVVSKSVRAQNRAELSGNPNRGNPNAGRFGRGQLGRKKRPTKSQAKDRKPMFHKIIIHENKTYRVGYELDGSMLNVIAVVSYGDPLDTDSYLVYKNSSPICKTIGLKLMITLNVEAAQAAQ